MGRLTKDAETKYSQGNEPVAISRYTLAVNKAYKREGEPDADFINCVSFGKQGELAEKYFKKGMMLGVTGRISTRSYEDQTGQRKYITEVISDNIYFAESKRSSDERAEQNSRMPEKTATLDTPPTDDDFDDLPF